MTKPEKTAKTRQGKKAGKNLRLVQSTARSQTRIFKKLGRKLEKKPGRKQGRKQARNL